MIYRSASKAFSVRGFTLVEILVVMVIMGLVVSTMYGLFIDSNRNANISEEVVDLQQNLRVAVDVFAADVRMAGYLIPTDVTAIENAPATIGIDLNQDGDFTDTDETGEKFTFNTASSQRIYARVVSEDGSGAGLVVEDDMDELFSDNEYIYVIRPTTKATVSGILKIGTIDSADQTANRLPLTGTTDTYYTTAYAVGNIAAGDMVVRKLDGEATPATPISYWLQSSSGSGATTNNYDLVRDDGVQTAVVASNISTMSLSYFDLDGNATTDPDEIRSIRIDISAEIDNTLGALVNMAGSNKTRSLQTLVKIRNTAGG